MLIQKHELANPMRLCGPDLFPVYDFNHHSFILIHIPTQRTVLVTDHEVEDACGALSGHWATAYFCVQLARDKLQMHHDDQVPETMRTIALRLYADEERENLRVHRAVDLIKQFRVLRGERALDPKTGEERSDEQHDRSTEADGEGTDAI